VAVARELYTVRKEIALYMRRMDTQNNTKTKNAQNRKPNIHNKKTNTKRIIRNIEQVIKT
jgi:hypothetical protein